MGLLETITRLSDSFAKKKVQLTPEERKEKELAKLALSKELYQQFEATVVFNAIDKINSVPGINLQRLYTKDGLMYKVSFSFFNKPEVKIMFMILSEEKEPEKIEVAYVYNVGTPKAMNHRVKLTIKDSAETIVDVFEQGVQICGPK